MSAAGFAPGPDTGADPVLDELGNILLECLRLEHPLPEVTQHILCAIHARFDELGYAERVSTHASLGLQPWQELVATSLLRDTSGQGAGMPAIAAACGMPATQFFRAFRAHFLCTPQEWRLDARLAKAKALMLQTPLSLTQIALECGFAEQSHFNHTFIRRVGMSPGAWRRGEKTAG